MTSFAEQRERMIAEQLLARGIRDPDVLAAFRAVPRELFVPEPLRHLAYEDGPLPIGLGQTISQPHVVALMLELARLSSDSRVLEIGAGSGYAAALLSHLAGRVFTIERHAPLLAQATARFRELGLANISTCHGDGALGWPEEAPFHVILLTAAAAEVPPALVQQLAPGGSLVLPAGPSSREQSLLRLTRLPDGALRRENFGPVSFVPLLAGLPEPAG